MFRSLLDNKLAQWVFLHMQHVWYPFNYVIGEFWELYTSNKDKQGTDYIDRPCIDQPAEDRNGLTYSMCRVYWVAERKAHEKGRKFSCFGRDLVQQQRLYHGFLWVRRLLLNVAAILAIHLSLVKDPLIQYLTMAYWYNLVVKWGTAPYALYCCWIKRQRNFFPGP